MAQAEIFKLPSPVCRAIRQLNSAGFEAFIVGGCVRDMLMQREPNDFDITTSALPEDIIRTFSGEQIVLTGLKHGTVSVLLDGMYLEITTYRIDGTYTDGRHPEKVSFSASLREDLARRDFTINAMAYSPEAGVLDFYDGEQDLAEGRIRTVGPPLQRFSEDALRMLRAYRFAATLNFTIEEVTKETAAQLFQEIKKVSVERITAEFIRLLEGPGAGRILNFCPEILQVILGFSNVTPALCSDCGQAMDCLPPIFRQRLAALVLLAGERLSSSLLRMDRKTDRFIDDTIDLASAFPASDDYNYKCLLQKHGEQPLLEMMHVLYAVSLRRRSGFLPAANVLNGIRIVNKIQDTGVCYSLHQLAVTGEDVMRIKGCQGQETGRVLAALLEAVMRGILPNKREILLGKIIDT